jgi:hypothetical protein
VRSRVWEPSWFERPPDLWVDRGAAERGRILRQLLRELRGARLRRDPWYVWVVEEYARTRRARRGGGRKR